MTIRWTSKDYARFKLGLPPRRKRDNPEEKLCIGLSDWMFKAFPDVIYHFDYGSGLKMTKLQSAKQKRLNKVRGFPDLQILEPRGVYHGLFLELKVENPYTRDFKLKAGEHLREQEEIIRRLLKKGYYATFAAGLDEAMLIIEKYLNLKNKGKFEQGVF